MIGSRAVTMQTAALVCASLEGALRALLRETSTHGRLLVGFFFIT